MWRDLWSYLKALWKHWVALVSGAGSVIMGAVNASRKWPLPGWSFWVVALVCFFIASFRAWRDAHTELEGLRVSNRRDLHLTITDAHTQRDRNWLFVEGLLNNAGSRQATLTSLDLMYRHYAGGIGKSPQWEGFHIAERTLLPIIVEPGKSVPFRIKGNYDAARIQAATKAEKPCADGQKLAIALMTTAVDDRGQTHRFTYVFAFADASEGGLTGMYRRLESVNILEGEYFETCPFAHGT